jgi:two-component system, LuxR family, response regulator FixJ
MTPSKTIFLVDDDEFVRESLCALLEAYEFKVEAFASGREFLATQDGRADGCLLLDIHMPEMSGLDILKKLRAQRNATPAILITGRRDPAIEVQARALGAVALLDKPIPHTMLLAALRQAFIATLN